MQPTTTTRHIEVGLLKVDVTGRESERLERLVARATTHFRTALRDEPRLTVSTYAVDRPNLSPGEKGYRALDFVQLGLDEKTERRLAFLLVVTEVDIAAASLSYLLALPSQLTNVAIVSTRRLADYGAAERDDAALMGDRLGTLLVHCFGRLLNLPYHPAADNYLARIREPHDLDAMRTWTAAQLTHMARTLPEEANDRYSQAGKWGFVLRQTLANVPRIVRGALNARPLRLATKLPTMIATALSGIILLIFGGETWDFAAAVDYGQLAVFVVASFVTAVFVLYRAFSFRLVATRRGRFSESAVVTAGATYLALVLTLLILFAAFALLMYGVVVFVFPDALMSSWTSVRDGAEAGAHLRLVLFLAAVGLLSGSLGGSADSRTVVRNVLFAADET